MGIPVNPAPYSMLSAPPRLGELATIVGVPLEYSGVGRPGSRLAPAALREASQGLTPYSRRARLYVDTGLLGDIGDIIVDEPGSTLERVSHVYERLVGETMPVLLGGEHSITYGVALALSKLEKPLLLFVDAHLDARVEYRGYRIASPTVTLRAAELLGGDSVVHVGARSYHPSERRRLEELGVKILDVDELEKLGELVSMAEHVHLSIDVDILDPCFEPGAVTPEPEGVEPSKLYDLVYMVARKAKSMGMDIVEYTPLYDPSRIGAVYAVKTLVEAVAARLASGTSQARR